MPIEHVVLEWIDVGGLEEAGLLKFTLISLRSHLADNKVYRLSLSQLHRRDLILQVRVRAQVFKVELIGSVEVSERGEQHVQRTALALQLSRKLDDAV